MSRSKKKAVGALAGFGGAVIPMSETPCPRCLVLAKGGAIRSEAIMPLPEGAFAPLADDAPEKVCRDCAAAFTLLRSSLRGMPFSAARLAVANCRQESLRLPGVPIGLIQTGLVEPSLGADALDRHHAWLDRAVPEWVSLDSFPGERC